MGFTSHDDMINQITTNGKYRRMEINKNITPAHTATAGWHLLNGLAGYPNAQTYPGTDLVWQSCWETTGDGTVVAGPQHGGVVAPGTKHVLNIGAMINAAAGAPWQAKLVDLQGYYRLSTTNVTGTGSRGLINSNNFTASSSSGLLLTYTNDFNTLTKVRFTNSGGALPTGLSINTDYYLVRVSSTTARVATSLANAIAGTVVAYTDGGSGTHTLRIQMRADQGIGCQACLIAQTAPTGGGPNMTASAYDAPGTYDGSGTRAFQGSPSHGAAADAYATRVLHSGVVAGRYGPFYPLQGADTGIARINSFTLSGGSAYTGSGVLAMAIVKPLADLLLPATGIYSERDLINQLPSMPKVDDGACLAWMLFATGATTNLSPFTANIDVGWG
jgi:hypothetical protein